ncbi:MAG: AbrB/MazE/SpoVT family DNA-binding domain-containing protein [Oscillatoriales cyanobacterium SM2_2_1]|nr:AbrB/MazE/SpoVT family DNA-binding domain-containing protein [Oscillatoriales cyanobacterium SM2_2_1]
MPPSRPISLHLSGQDQVLTIPGDLALSSTEVLLRKEGERLIVEPIATGSLLALLLTLEDIAEDFPDTDGGTLPIDEVTL